MRLRMNDKRERRFERLLDAPGEDTKIGALDVAADYYIRMDGNTGAAPTGKVADLIQLADEKGCFTGDEIADVLITDEL